MLMKVEGKKVRLISLIKVQLKFHGRLRNKPQ